MHDFQVFSAKMINLEVPFSQNDGKCSYSWRSQPHKPFQIIYSLFQHEYLGLLIESYIVHLDEKGKLTFQHQNISSKMPVNFRKDLTIATTSWSNSQNAMEQSRWSKSSLVNRWSRMNSFQSLQQNERQRGRCRTNWNSHREQKGRKLLNWWRQNAFEMGSDGEPTWKKIEGNAKQGKAFSFISCGATMPRTTIQPSPTRERNLICPASRHTWCAKGLRGWCWMESYMALRSM